MLKTCCKLHANPSSKYSIVQFVQDWAFRVNHWISLLSPVCALNQAVLNMVNSHSLDLQSIVGVYPCPWTLSKVWWFQDIIFNLHTQEMSTFYPEWFYITKQINNWQRNVSFLLADRDIPKGSCQNMLPLFGSCLWSRFFVSSQIQYFFPLLSLHFMLCGPRKWKYIQQTK